MKKMDLNERIKLWRDRFYGRQEVFGSKISYTSKQDGKIKQHYVTEFMPAYKTAEARKNVNESVKISDFFVPLTDEHILHHINGHKELLIYLLHTDGTVRFAAIDFDLKHTFEDVKACYDMISIAHGIPSYVARSTKKGHHLYLFFDKPIEAKYVTSYLASVYEELNMLEDHRNGIKPLPETFPKNISIPDCFSTGYGIKPPMQGEGMGMGQNCWVTIESGADHPVGGSGNCEEQWDYFANTQKIDVDAFKDYLAQNNIPIEDIRISEAKGVVEEESRVRSMPYKVPIDGDINRVIHGCPAMKRFWEGPAQEFNHEARVALCSWAIQCKNGLDVLRERWQGSVESEKQIQYAIDRYQKPWSCAAMQAHNLCICGKDPKFTSGTKADIQGEIIADYCFKKSSPKEMIHGKLVTNPHKLPEEQWPSPSPIRLRNYLQKYTVEELKEEIDQLNKEDPEIGDRISELYAKTLTLSDKKKRTQVEDYLKSKKLAKVKELKVIAEEAREHRKLEAERELEESGKTKWLNGNHYMISEKTGGYSVIEIGKNGEEIEREFSNFTIELTRHLYISSLIHEDLQTFSGYLIIGGVRKPFEISVDDFSLNPKLAQAINRCGGLTAMIANHNLDHLRFAIHLFGRTNMKVEHRYEDYGFDCYNRPEIYRATSRNISADSISEEGACVDLTGGGHAQHLNIKEISNARFCELVKIIKDDFLTFQDRSITFTTLAHSLQATIQMAFFPFKNAPVLWVQGLTGAGKTTISMMAQSFHGDFPRLLNVTGTPKALEYATMLFKDSLLVLDDYKEGFNRHSMMQLIQKIYDRTARARLRANLEQANAPFCRGLVMMTAEDAPSSEASVLARCIYLEAPQIASEFEYDEEDNPFHRIEDNMKDFSGITGRFIQYVLSIYGRSDALTQEFRSLNTHFARPVVGLQNGRRAAQNITANYLTWKLFCDFLLHNKLLTSNEHTTYTDTHYQNMCKLRDQMVEACSQEQASNLFLDGLRESILGGHLRIDGMANNVNDNATSVGFIENPKENVVYIYPQLAIAEVKKLMQARGAPLSHSETAIGKQLRQDNMLIKADPGRGKIRKRHRGSRVYVWALDSLKSGVGPQNRTGEEEESECLVDMSNPSDW